MDRHRDLVVVGEAVVASHAQQQGVAALLGALGVVGAREVLVEGRRVRSLGVVRIEREVLNRLLVLGNGLHLLDGGVTQIRDSLADLSWAQSAHAGILPLRRLSAKHLCRLGTPLGRSL